ncbi:hypothetical protein [Streptomyces mirabilis]|uniref:hypothetical protein n=1 Tax=Streptomyces mirabilis TaxID=68239 RepID=UPI003652BDFC
MDVAELGADSVAGLAGATFGDADQSRVGRRSGMWARMRWFEAMGDRLQFQPRCPIAESVLGFQERLAADRDLLGGQVRVGAGR